jgi:peptide-methionine (S)-S-oxide reductase
VRTRVGYAGGTTADPTYRTIGDHTETLEIDFDPASISCRELLEIFWASHRPTSPPWSRQYASIIFWHDNQQRIEAEASKREMERRVGPMHTEVTETPRFYPAEDYHQKYRLRNTPALYREFRGMYPSPTDFRDSKAAARVNGYLDGWGSPVELEREIAGYGLSTEGADALREAVAPARGSRAKAGGR